jgi:hypothetical protein
MRGPITAIGANTAIVQPMRRRPNLKRLVRSIRSLRVGYREGKVIERLNQSVPITEIARLIEGPRRQYHAPDRGNDPFPVFWRKILDSIRNRQGQVLCNQGRHVNYGKVSIVNELPNFACANIHQREQVRYVLW